TFNWDLLLEQALHQLDRDWSYHLDENAISILKLHGSVDWFNGHHFSIRPDLIYPLNPTFKRIQVFRFFRLPKVATPVVPVIIPPVVNKRIDYDELKSIWRDAWK